MTINPYEERARTHKVRTLCRFIRNFARKQHGAVVYEHPEKIAEAVASMPDEGWDEVAKAAGCRSPSDETKRRVIRALRRYQPRRTP